MNSQPSRPPILEDVMSRAITLAVDVDADPTRVAHDRGDFSVSGHGKVSRAETGTSVLFRHYGFGDGYAEIDLGHTAQTWALIMERLARYVATGTPEPFFPAASA
jgi:hypothetical protein